ncbi:MAG TPA: N-acyl homoserine lactonase family protein [Porticoccaceae bacterium]|jgi:glyoxylase-like metal-dependent hydrolase (beta-lactamase superfamily II)|nr:N-acyl homoserine lactonase family protein [Gammaproteobacteria bacterium]HIL60120.1 N-acyl homoserine lactonase family protein [Porticoccaceae bacterium]
MEYLIYFTGNTMKKIQIILVTIFLSLLTTAIASMAYANPTLSVFDCGLLAFDDVSDFGITNNDTEVRELFVPCYLISHDDHLMVWDAGLPLSDVGRTDSNTRYRKSFIDQLAEMNIDTSEIDFVAFSHMHYDHVGSANAFSEATLLIQGTEAVAAFEHPEDNPVFRPELYADLLSSNRTTLNGDYDVFGDGSVRIISAPGHTPGHQALYLELENFGPLILSGDLYHFEVSRALRRTPVFNTDAEETLRSMDKVEALIRSTGATFWIEHSKELAESLNLAPAVYD